MKKLGYSRIPLLLVSALAALAVPVVPQAAPTDIAQVPVLNISGTGSVKPNIMLLLDNSGSMDWAYMPDYVGGSGSNSNMCRTNATYASSPTVCKPGDPPFMAADFNGVYYNPDVSYAPPLYANGTAYASMTSAVTTGWTKVPTDGYNVQNNDMFGSTATTTNLVTGFPDRKWCDASNSSSCVTNTSYTYPDATYTDPVTIYKADQHPGVLHRQLPQRLQIRSDRRRSADRLRRTGQGALVHHRGGNHQAQYKRPALPGNLQAHPCLSPFLGRFAGRCILRHAGHRPYEHGKPAVERHRQRHRQWQFDHQWLGVSFEL